MDNYLDGQLLPLCQSNQEQLYTDCRDSDAFDSYL